MNAIAQYDQNGDGPVRQVQPVPARDQVSTAQIHACLSILNCLQAYVLRPYETDDSLLPKRLDGGAPAAATATVIQVCDRLEKILADDSRWNLSDSDALYNSILETQKAMREQHAKHVQYLQEVQRPSKSYLPRLCIIQGEYIAYAGDTAFPSGLVLGKGGTPEEALRDFDRAFTRSPEDQLRFTDAAVEKIRRALLQENGGVDTPPPPAVPMERPGYFKRLATRFGRLFKTGSPLPEANTDAQ